MPAGTRGDDPAVPLARPQFEVHLDVFDGPFDLLLGLIAKHKLDVTEVALSKVTDDFIAYIEAFGSEWDLEQTTHFLVVASTLLDLKAARLLPQADVDDEEDLALLEARDLLFARLMQYKAYKQVAAVFAGRMADAAKTFPRSVTLEPRFADLLPEVVIAPGPQELAKLAAEALRPKEPATVSVDHIHHPRVSVREQAVLLVERLRDVRQANFRSLTADCTVPVEVIARFLAVLELFREGVVAFEQVTPLGELNIRWTGTDESTVDVEDEYDAQEKAGEDGDE
ncbi:MAG: segregation/condensation protein A [Streptosporangiales bacterium]|nr:segregation/condensation protein A [Streptosporangiales bacterium]